MIGDYIVNITNKSSITFSNTIKIYLVNNFNRYLAIQAFIVVKGTNLCVLIFYYFWMHYLMEIFSIVIESSIVYKLSSIFVSDLKLKLDSFSKKLKI